MYFDIKIEKIAESGVNQFGLLIHLQFTSIIKLHDPVNLVLKKNILLE